MRPNIVTEVFFAISISNFFLILKCKFTFELIWSNGVHVQSLGFWKLKSPNSLLLIISYSLIVLGNLLLDRILIYTCVLSIGDC